MDRNWESNAEKVARVVKEKISLVPYDPMWPLRFEAEKRHLRACLPAGPVGRIEHFGSTAVPGLLAKPIVDILVEVNSAVESKTRIAPILEAQNYEYFWRPTFGDSTPPFYAWFIKRDTTGARTHHIHMVEPDFDHWDGLLFRDYLIEHPDVANQYAALKQELASRYPNDREAYTAGKGDFVRQIICLVKNE